MVFTLPRVQRKAFTFIVAVEVVLFWYTSTTGFTLVDLESFIYPQAFLLAFKGCESNFDGF